MSSQDDRNERTNCGPSEISGISMVATGSQSVSHLCVGATLKGITPTGLPPAAPVL